MRFIAYTMAFSLLFLQGCASDPWQSEPGGADPGADRPTAHIEGAEEQVSTFSRLFRSDAREEVSPRVPVFQLRTAECRLVHACDRSGGQYRFVFGPWSSAAGPQDPGPLAYGEVAPPLAPRPAELERVPMARFSLIGAPSLPVDPRIGENQVDVFQIDSGMGLFWGVRPKVRSRRVYTGGYGSEFLFYVEPPLTPGGATAEHIVLVEPTAASSAQVYKLVGGQPVGGPVILTAGNRYARLAPDGTLTQSATVPPEIQAVMDYARQQRMAAGY